MGDLCPRTVFVQQRPAERPDDVNVAVLPDEARQALQVQKCSLYRMIGPAEDSSTKVEQWGEGVVTGGSIKWS